MLMTCARPSRVLACLLYVLFAGVVPAASAADAPRKAPWRRLYAGAEATGENVIALWQFAPGAEAEDTSGGGHKLTLRGKSRFVPNGLFGACLESFNAGRADKPNGAFAANRPELTPPGAFTLEMWIKPKPKLAKIKTSHLLDKQYHRYKDKPGGNRDYCLCLKLRSGDTYRLYAYLGYGGDSERYTSNDVTLRAGTWYHVAFSYDGAGTGRFFLNGKAVGKTRHEGRGAVAAGKHPLVIGDRVGSTHSGFPGFIDQVRISKGVVPCFAGSLLITLNASRTCFVRMEKDAHIRLDVTNDTAGRLRDGKIRVSFGGGERELRVGDLAPGKTFTAEVRVDTTLRPGAYPMKLTVSAQATEGTLKATESAALVIVPRPLPLTMPVVAWSGRGTPKLLKDIGFTHNMIWLTDPNRVWKAGKPTQAMGPSGIADRCALLNKYLAEGFGAVAKLNPGRSGPARNEKFARVGRDGKPYSKQRHTGACANFPEIRALCYNVGASVARTFGRFPALQAAIIHTEIRGSTELCFHKHDREAFKKFAGYDIPEAAVRKRGVSYTQIKGFPANRIVKDDDHLLTFYRWFWKTGDGWNGLHTLVHRGLKSTGRKDLWTFYDPAVRVPSVWGSGGEVDILSQWTYSYPDPIKMGQATDELFAMAAGGPDYQKVMKMTQIIWYRSQTAPHLPKAPARRAPWEKGVNADARFITIAPDHLRIAFWSKIARPIRGIMYHGLRSLMPFKGQEKAGYRNTNTETVKVLKELVRDVVRPLGPTLLQVPDRKSDVGLLESFTSQIFAGRGTYGWSNKWEADAHLILQWARIQPRIIYEETILRDGLDDFRVLVMPNCDVLTESVFRKVREFQKKGGIVVADENLAPALVTDIFIRSYRRTGKADVDKAALQAKAARLRKELAPFYKRYGDSSDPDVVVRLRRYGPTDYLFAVNDKRTFGSYVGHHGRVMEKGVPNSAVLSVSRKSGYVYDLVAHKPVPVSRTTHGLEFKADFGPGGGRLFMITPGKVANVHVAAPPKAKLGGHLKAVVSVTDGEGSPVNAVVPVRVEILDSRGRPAEFSGYYGAKDGRVSLKLELAPNDAPGTWTIKATELASGLSGAHTFQVGP